MAEQKKLNEKYTPPKVYDGYFDISHMIEFAEKNHVCFVIAVSEDKERGAGKTYSSAKFLYEKYLKNGERFVILVRNMKELGSSAAGMFAKYMSNEHSDTVVYEKIRGKGAYSEVIADSGTDEDRQTDIMGFVIPLKAAKEIKKYSSIFSGANVRRFYFDEFMPLDGNYISDETTLMKSIYDSVNRDIEDLPIVMTANCITLGNPYFHMLGLNNKIQSNTRKIQTDTCIYEKVEVRGLADRHMNSAANRAFGQYGEKYISNVWIADSNALTCKPEGWGRSMYVATLIYKEQKIGVHYYMGVNMYYLSRKVDSSCDYMYALTVEGVNNAPLLKASGFMETIKKAFYGGMVRVSDNAIQRILLDIFG